MTQIKSVKNLSEQDFIEYDMLNNSIGRIGNPLLWLPLKSNLDMICGAGSVTFTRSTTATYIDRYGVVQNSAINAARFEKEGLLLEGTSTNKCLQSEDFSNASWAKFNATISSNATAAPDGNTTADKLVEDTSTARHKMSQAIGGFSGGETITFSIFAKADELDTFRIRVRDGVSANTNMYFDLTNNVCSDTSYGKITSLANNWYRCDIKKTIDSSSTTTTIVIDLTETYEGDVTYLGDGSSGLYFWGAQLEELPFASSYIPTTDAAVTRTYDICTVTYDNNMPAPNTEEMTVILDGDYFGGRTYEQYYFSIPGETSRRAFYWTASGEYVPRYLTFIYYPISFCSYSLDFNTVQRHGFVFNKNSLKIFTDGVKENEVAISSTVTGTATGIKIGCNINNYNQLFGHISNFQIYDIALTDNEMKLA